MLFQNEVQFFGQSLCLDTEVVSEWLRMFSETEKKKLERRKILTKNEMS